MPKNNVNDPLGVIEGSALPTKALEHFDVGDGWVIVMNGEEDRRPRELRRVAYTRAEITFDSEKDLSKFLEIIKKTDERLSKVPDSQVMYDWQKIRRRGLTVRFGVAWYDEDFYRQRKDAHLSSLHQGVLSQFGVTPESLRIEHIPL
ncbi:MAG TPA: hypothetical protein VF543_06310 [Pyrinomonadaceae bacterium]|jgi:uncharacterized protein YecA (UPF0149 family)